MPCFSGDAICDGRYLNWEYRQKHFGLNETDINNLTIDELEKNETDRMKFNAFKVCEEVAQRIDGEVAPQGFMKAYCTEDLKDLFFWDTRYLRDYLANKDAKNSKTMPGSHYYKSLQAFMDQHTRKGEKYLEYLKFSCKDNGHICTFCLQSGWTGPPCSRIPEPMPDYESDKFKYLHVAKTPTEVDKEIRQVNDMNPRVQLKAWFAEGQLTTKNTEKISEFSRLYAIKEDIIVNALTELEQSQFRKEVRLMENKRKRVTEDENEFKDYDWKKIVENKSIKGLKVSELDKYLAHCNLLHFLHLKKAQKIEAIIEHLNNAVIEDETSTNNDSDLDSEGQDSEDDVIGELARFNDKESDGGASDIEERANDTELDEHFDELFRKTRYGRLAGTHHLSAYR